MSRVRTQPDGEHDLPVEEVDVVVVGCRIAGCAAAATFARGDGAPRVVALDHATFPSNTLSTHLCQPGHLVEFRRVGALERCLAYGAPPIYWAYIHAGRQELLEQVPDVDGIDFCVGMGRPELDMAFVDTARDAGVDLRERSRVTGLVRRAGRVAGVQYLDLATRERHEIRAKLVVGADGFHGPIAGWLGVDRPYRASINGRGAILWYLDDPMLGTLWRHRWGFWRGRRTQVQIVPMGNERMLVILGAPREDIAQFRRDPIGSWERVLCQERRVADRVAGARLVPEKLRRDHYPSSGTLSADKVLSYFRVSTGPGWVLCGDSGHRKDPYIGQGIRDACRYGRMMAEVAAPVLHDPARLDAALVTWEQVRDAECREAYHWGNRVSSSDLRFEATFAEVLRQLRPRPSRRRPGYNDALSRTVRPRDAVTIRDAAAALTRAMLRPDAPRKEIIQAAALDARREVDLRLEPMLARGRYSTRRSPSEDPDWTWPLGGAHGAAARGREDLVGPNGANGTSRTPASPEPAAAPTATRPASR